MQHESEQLAMQHHVFKMNFTTAQCRETFRITFLLLPFQQSIRNSNKWYEQSFIVLVQDHEFQLF